jgi:anti-sigma regulatory factor (Ser/Thr protein kinase)
MAFPTVVSKPMTQQMVTVPARLTAAAGTDAVAKPRPAHRPLRLPAQPSAVAVARRHVSQLLRAWQLADLTATAQLLASELVANAVRAAQAAGSAVAGAGPPTIELAVRRTRDSIIIEVRDPSLDPPLVRQAGPLDEGGRGLLIVHALGTGCGHYLAPGGGKVVWCELALALRVTVHPGRRGPREPSGDRPRSPGGAA